MKNSKEEKRFKKMDKAFMDNFKKELREAYKLTDLMYPQNEKAST